MSHRCPYHRNQFFTNSRQGQARKISKPITGGSSHIVSFYFKLVSKCNSEAAVKQQMSLQRTHHSDHTLKKSVAVRWYTGGLGEVPVEERPVVLMLLRHSSSPMSSNTTTSPPVTRGGLMPAVCWWRTTDLTSVENTVSVTSRC